MPNDAAGRRAAPRRLAGLAAVIAVVLSLVPGAVVGSATASPAPGSEEPIWAMAQDGDLLRGFDRSDFNERDGSPRVMQAEDGRMGLQFQLEPGDQRSELEPEMPNQTEGEVQWYTYSALLANSFPADVETWQVVLQWHHEGQTGSPPIAVEVRNNRLEVAAEGENFQDLGPISGGDRIDLTMRILFSRDTSKGTVDVWRDGQHALRGFRPPGGTLLDNFNYLKVGYYRDDGINDFGRLWLQDLRVGRTLESVRTDDAGPAVEVPREADPAPETAAPPADAADDDSNTLAWIGGGLVLVLVLVGAGVAIARRKARI